MILKAFRLTGKTEDMLTADQAAETHKEGDRYEDILTGKPLRLHIKRAPNGPRNHFEWEPRWES